MQIARPLPPAPRSAYRYFTAALLLFWPTLMVCCAQCAGATSQFAPLPGLNSDPKSSLACKSVSSSLTSVNSHCTKAPLNWSSYFNCPLWKQIISTEKKKFILLRSVMNIEGGVLPSQSGSSHRTVGGTISQVG